MNLVISRQTLQERIALHASEIHRDFPDATHAVIVLNGGLHFASRLLLELGVDLLPVYVRVSSYRGTRRAAHPSIASWLGPSDLAGARVLVIDDIADTGETLDLICDSCVELGATIVRCAVLLQRASCPVRLSWSCFTVAASDFFVGFGLDLDGRYRNLSAVYSLDPEEHHAR